MGEVRDAQHPIIAQRSAAITRAAYRLAATPLAAADADWRQELSALREISSHCRACHDAFRVE